MTANRFVVLTAPRTGSNWLCSLLDSHPRVLCHHEIFNPEAIHPALSLRASGLDLGTVAERDRDPLAVLARIWADAHGRDAVGFKLNRGQDARVFDAVLADASVRKVVLRRRNRVRTCVSERMAERTGEWESTPGLPIGGRAPLRLSAEDVRAHAAANAAYYDGLERRLRALRQGWLDVAYEELQDAGEHGRILAFLGVEAPWPLRALTRRQNGAPLCELLTDYEALADALRGTPFARELAEP